MMIDLKKAMLDPTRVFSEPADVVANKELTRDQKIEILRRWEYDAHQLEVAEEEAGMAVRRPEMFDQVIQALHALGADRDHLNATVAPVQRRPLRVVMPVALRWSAMACGAVVPSASAASISATMRRIKISISARRCTVP